MKETIRQAFLDHGADLCGFAGIELFGSAPEGFHPLDIFRRCRTVIVFAKALPKGMAHVSPRIVYRHANNVMIEILDQIACKGSLDVESHGGIAVPLPSDGPYEYWDPARMEGRGLLSMRHAAELAGLGTIGKNTLIANERFGSMISIGAVLTDLVIESDPPARQHCLPTCRICIDGCPAGALDGVRVDQKRCRSYAYDTTNKGVEVTVCNRCRINCPRAFGI